MSIIALCPKIALSPPVYNPEAKGFAARARVTEAGTTITYRVMISAAPHADFDTLAKGLKRQALVQHQQGRARTHRFIQDTVRAALSRAHSPTLGAFLAA